MLAYPLADLRVEVVEDQVRVLLRHWAHVRDVVPHHDVGEVEKGGRSVRQVRDDQRVRHATCLVQQNHIGDLKDQNWMKNFHLILFNFNENFNFQYYVTSPK